MVIGTIEKRLEQGKDFLYRRKIKGALTDLRDPFTLEQAEKVIETASKAIGREKLDRVEITHVLMQHMTNDALAEFIRHPDSMISYLAAKIGIGRIKQTEDTVVRMYQKKEEFGMSAVLDELAEEQLIEVLHKTQNKKLKILIAKKLSQAGKKVSS
jgi:hypothetical protein